ncbi:MAG: hypothetical protein ACK56F_20865 [bacterium]
MAAVPAVPPRSGPPALQANHNGQNLLATTPGLFLPAVLACQCQTDSTQGHGAITTMGLWHVRAQMRVAIVAETTGCRSSLSQLSRYCGHANPTKLPVADLADSYGV